MPSRNLDRTVDGFPFPYQPSPVAAKQGPKVTGEEHAYDTSSASPSPAMNIEAPRKLGSLLESDAKSERSADYTFYPNDENKRTLVLRGGFGPFMNLPELSINKMRCYPPLPNSAYGLTSQAHITQNAHVTFKVYTPSAVEGVEEDEDALYMDRIQSARCTDVDGSAAVEDLDGHHDKREANRRAAGAELEDNHKSINDLVYNPPPRQPVTFNICSRIKEAGDPEQSLPASLHRTKTRGEKLADTINFNRAGWVMTPPGISGVLYPGEEQRVDYIKHVDNIDEEKWELDYCRICKNTHIPPGSPITLEDRDTCGAYLPEWFPNDEFERPWFSFNRLINEMVKLHEIQQGYAHKPNPDQPFWDLQFHEYSSKWKAIGKRGGWWKCRDGEDATEVERNCQVCHSELVDKDRATDCARRGASVAQRLTNIQEFIAGQMKVVGERDKALAVAQIRAEGYPQYLGPRTIEDIRFERLGLHRIATVETMLSIFPVDDDATPNGRDLSLRGASPPRGRSPVSRGMW